MQPEFDLTYGIFYSYIWGSNNAFNPETIELDYGAGITPKLWGLDLNIAALYYTYPGTNDLDYLEVRTSAAHTFNKWTLSIGNWWSPDNFNAGTQSDAIEGGVSYALSGKCGISSRPASAERSDISGTKKKKSSPVTRTGMLA